MTTHTTPPVTPGDWSVDNFFRALDAAVDLKGEDYVYPQSLRDPVSDACQYTAEGKPACIIGVVIDFIEGAPYTGPNNNASEVLSTYGAGVLVQELAAVAQRGQDCGETWDVARNQAYNIHTQIKG